MTAALSRSLAKLTLLALPPAQMASLIGELRCLIRRVLPSEHLAIPGLKTLLAAILYILALQVLFGNLWDLALRLTWKRVTLPLQAISSLLHGGLTPRARAAKRSPRCIRRHLAPLALLMHIHPPQPWLR